MYFTRFTWYCITEEGSRRKVKDAITRRVSDDAETYNNRIVSIVFYTEDGGGGGVGRS